MIFSQYLLQGLKPHHGHGGFVNRNHMLRRHVRFMSLLHFICRVTQLSTLALDLGLNVTVPNLLTGHLLVN